jgi:hypothetical protein
MTNDKHIFVSTSVFQNKLTVIFPPFGQGSSKTGVRELCVLNLKSDMSNMLIFNYIFHMLRKHLKLELHGA